MIVLFGLKLLCACYTNGTGYSINCNHQQLRRYIYSSLLLFRLLDPSITRQYDCLKKAYADILYRWNLLNKRVEVLKFIDEVPSPHRGLGEQQFSCLFFHEFDAGSCFNLI